MLTARKADIIEKLQGEILQLQGFRRPNSRKTDLGLGPIVRSFPDHVFPLGAVHEFLSTRVEDIATTCGFITGLLSNLLGKKGMALWISCARTLFPPALKNYGIDPDRIIFIDLKKEKHVLWALEEALKCKAVSAVVGELRDLSFTTSRRLQLAVEESNATGFLIHKTAITNTTACVSRWRITSLPSESIDDLPGIGFPQWNVELLKIKNGKPGTWKIKWVNGRFEPVHVELKYTGGLQSKAG